MVSPLAKRRALEYVLAKGLGSRSQGCRALGLSRSGVYRRPKVNESKEEMKEHIVTLSQENPRYGYRRITALMKRDGHRVNSKRVQRVRRNEGLQVSKRQRKMRRRGQSTAQRQKATHPGHVWSWDFIEDQTVYGKRIRILTIIDEYTRQWLHFRLSSSIRADDVIMALNEAITKYGAPEHIRSDNGPVPRSVATTKRERQFVAYAVQDWLHSQHIQTLYIKPGSPWENGHIESFHDKIRDECLNRELFHSHQEARIIIGDYRLDYNESRPHSALQYLSPNQFALALTALRPTAYTPSGQDITTINNNRFNQPESLLLKCAL
jgi:putative transposase